MAPRSARLISVVVAAVGLGLSPTAWNQRQAPSLAGKIRVEPVRADGIYKLGEVAGWTVSSLPGVGETLVEFEMRANNGTRLSNGMARLPGRFTQQLSPQQPMMLNLEIKEVGGQGALLFAAAIEPTKIQNSVPKPKEFDAFWRKKLAELRAIPANPVVTPKPADRAGIDYATVTLDHVHGTKVYGQIAKPSKPGKYPALLQLQWASPPYPLHPSWVGTRAQQGWLALNIQPHDVPVDESPEFYAGLPEELKNYTSINQEDRERNYFVEMYLRGVRAVDYLLKHPNWDGKTILVTGTSMGGNQAIAVAGLHPRLTHLMAHVASGADLNAAQHGRQGGYPNFNLQSKEAMETAKYVDIVNLAPRIRATSLISIGFVDTVCPPAGLWAAFNAIRAPKEVAAMVDSPHNHVATPEQQRPYTERFDRWLSDLVAGKPVTLRPGHGLPVRR